MLTNGRWMPSARLGFWVSVGSVIVGIAAGVLAGAQPLYLGCLLASVIVFVYFFADFGRTVLSLLVLRSSLDVFSAQQIPAVFAIGVDALTLLYVTVMILTGRTVHTDKFWWLFAGWVMLQSLWVILLPLGGLGLNASVLPVGIREWIRLFSWLMIYLLVMQLKDEVPPKKIISWLFFSLIPPLTVALMQMFLPSLLPSILSANVSSVDGGNPISSLLSEGSRIRGTLGVANTFATYLLLFMGLTWWKLNQVQRRWPWVLLLGLLAFLFVSTKSLFSLMMLCIFVLVLIAPRFSLPKLIGGAILLALVVGLFASSDFGQQRLGSIASTPLLNPNMDISRAILLSRLDNNSFNWRLAQWTFLLQSWQKSPILGYGLATSPYLSALRNLAHNDYVRALVEGGIVGLTTFLAFLGFQAIRLVQLLRYAPRGSAQYDLCLILLAIFLATLVGMSTENIWSHTTLYFYWWTLVAVAGWNWSEVQAEDSPVCERQSSFAPDMK